LAATVPPVPYTTLFRSNGVADAVERRVGARDLDVLDSGVVRLLQLGERHARVAGGVVGVERLHARDGCADVRLRSGLVRPRAEAIGRAHVCTTVAWQDR